MLLVGLTGGIAAGKSTVAGRLQALGARVIDADALARDVVAPGTPGLAAVAETFGDDLVVDGALDRSALGRIVFADPASRVRLESIVHPAVRARFTALLAGAPATAVVVHDVPLLVELGMAPQYHLVVLVHAAAATRVQRLVRDRGMRAADAAARVRAQADDAARAAVADVVLDNTGAGADVLDAVDRLWADRLVPYERNVREHRRAARPDRVQLCPHDPAWAGQAARNAARIGWSIREHPAAAGCPVEHIGSTAVPGLPAKDVIDLQLAVPSLAVADGLEPALSGAGWVRSPDNNLDSPHRRPGGPTPPDPTAWAKRFYGGTDPGVIVHLHVRARDSDGWWFSLLFRDWLRADADARRDYEAEKRRVAASTPDAAAYAGAKEPWFDAALPRAQAWADATGWEPGADAGL